MDGKKEMLRKKTHVVRKKTHVVRKFFYVASIFGGVARRRNRPPWELSSTAGELSSTAGDFSSTASRRRQRLQCVYRAPVFSGGAHTSLPDTNIYKGTMRVRTNATTLLGTRAQGGWREKGENVLGVEAAAWPTAPACGGRAAWRRTRGQRHTVPWWRPQGKCRRALHRRFR